jgi:hypothetical protein
MIPNREVYKYEMLIRDTAFTFLNSWSNRERFSMEERGWFRRNDNNPPNFVSLLKVTSCIISINLNTNPNPSL